MSTKKIIHITPINRSPHRCTITFEDLEGYLEKNDAPGYKQLKESVEKEMPLVSVDITRCHEGSISFVISSSCEKSYRKEVANLAVNLIVEALETGCNSVSIDELCAGLTHDTDPQIWFHGNPYNDTLGVMFRRDEVSLCPELLRVKAAAINNAAQGAFSCAPPDDDETGSVAFKLWPVYDRQPSNEYHVIDAVREIVEMLKAGCPASKQYDPDYARKMVIL